MKRDPLFYQLFKDLPGCFFQLIGRSESDAQRYELEAIEFKETSVRVDGVFWPLEPAAGPAYIWEAQYYSSDKVYANLMSKVGRFLEHGDPKQDWVAVVIYPNRSLEQKNLHPYRWLLASDQLLRIYLDDLPPAQPDQFEMGILELIAAKPDAALAKAQAMVPRLRASKRPKPSQRLLIQFIETIILYQFPKLSREEIETMLQVNDVRQTRVFQEALEEGIEKGKEEGRKEGRKEGREEGREEAVEQVVLQLVLAGFAIDAIASATGLSPSKIRRLKKSATKPQTRSNETHGRPGRD